MKTLLFSVLIVFSSCNGQKKAVIESENSTDTSKTPLTLLMSEEYSGLNEAETLIITDAKTLKTFFSKINRTRKPGLTVPNIDFLKEIIIIACSGEQMSGGLAIIPYVLEETDSKMVLSTKQENEKSLVTSSITSPFRMYTMPVTDKQITFQ